MPKSLYDERIIFTPEGMEGLYQSVAFTASSATTTNGIDSGEVSTQVLLFATQDCHIRASAAGDDALITDTFIPADVLVPFLITRNFKISAIRNATSGTLHISPVI